VGKLWSRWSAAVVAVLVVVGLVFWLAAPPPATEADPTAAHRAALVAELATLRLEKAVTDDEVAGLTAKKADLERQLGAITGRDNTPQVVQATVSKTVTQTEVVPISTFKHCYNFKYQQDAQAVYEADLSDPYGLDGSPGPDNGDGIACSTLPSDPHRPVSQPAGAYRAPKPPAPSVPALLAPSSKVRFGMYTEQSPFNYSEVDLVSSELGKKPDTIGFFLGWDQDYRPDAVTSAWQHGMLPLLTWESLPNLPLSVRTTTDTDYAMSKILSGQFDAYIDRFAQDVKTTGLPVIIRLDQEMNADYYPWSDTAPYNKRGQYVQVWRHVVDRFRAIGADKYVIWLWTPNRVDNIPQKQIASFYPGDDYVDWVGVDGYWRNKSEAANFGVTYAKTLGLLRALTHKPIFIGEAGATETGGKKVAWLNSFFANLPLNPDIIGFSYFSLTVAGGVGAATASNDWRINSSGTALAAFKVGIADARYGVYP
jgi:mannan endo-1,4-beta-mannosidase